MTYPTPRRLELRLLDTDRLTLLEFAESLAAAEVREAEAAPLLQVAFKRRHAEPGEYLRAMRLCYAIVWCLERRRDRSLTWAEAQTWDVVPIEATTTEIEAARIAREADELVAGVALGTGLPPDVAGELSMSQVAAIGAARTKVAQRRRRARVHR